MQLRLQLPIRLNSLTPKEATMHYKTIALELLEDRPQLKAHLQQHRQMLLAVESCAQTLKSFHEHWKAQLTAARPPSDPSQIASEALELALRDLADRLPSESSVNEALDWLDPAMLLRLLPSSAD
jgi:hypothetical protein